VSADDPLKGERTTNLTRSVHACGTNRTRPNRCQYTTEVLPAAACIVCGIGLQNVAGNRLRMPTAAVPMPCHCRGSVLVERLSRTGGDPISSHTVLVPP
jgi:hypothetical protein